MKDLEDLIAISLYQARVSRLKNYIRALYKDYEQYLKPLEDVRRILAEEIPEKRALSQAIVELRRRETH
ncbi:MAG: hypothetical protein NDF52_09170 [archaeon YNP-WB-062]|jgi:hypothetical protein|nr:hypothetical protein [Candidatus Culexarchaeum yellowstonense]